MRPFETRAPVRERMLSLTDIWRAQGAPENRKPQDWLRHEGAALNEAVALTRDLPKGPLESPLAVPERGRDGRAFAHWQVALAYAKYLTH